MDRPPGPTRACPVAGRRRPADRARRPLRGGDRAAPAGGEPLPGDPLRGPGARPRRPADRDRQRHPGSLDVSMSRDRTAGLAATPPSAIALASALAVLGAMSGGACSAGPLDVASLSPTSLETGMLAYWTFDESTGT